MESKKICIVGLGYIGLPTAAVLALSKQFVIGLDTNKDIVNNVNKGKVHIIEPGLLDAVNKAINSGYLEASNKPMPAEVFVIAVPTPFKNKNHEPDLSYIKSAADNISSVLKPGDLIILESTSPVGTSELLRTWLSRKREDLKFCGEGVSNPDIFIAYCPERVLPGNTLKELLNNDRVIGGLCEKSSDLAESFYKSFIQGNCFKTNARTAEMTKLTENSFRDVNIALANELSLICKKLDIDVWDLIELANMHPRVDILNPGAGVGGHCIAVDPWFIIDKSPEAELIKQARFINDRIPIEIVEEITNYCEERDDINIGIYGLTYKANIDDLRESPSMEIATKLIDKFPNRVFAVEPHVSGQEEEIKNKIPLVLHEEAISKCELIVILVPHQIFKNLFNSVPKNVHILDYCGLRKSRTS